MLPGVYPILDADVLENRGLGVAVAAAALLEGGAEILQLRKKDHWSRAYFKETQQVARWCRQQGATLIVNDRADMAMLLEAGLHLGQDDLAPRDARKLLGPDALLGYSTHNAQQLCAGGGEPVSYIALGPIFATGSKRNPDPLVGVEQLAAWRGLTHLPLVAIGGITRENARTVLAAGADSVAVIGDLFPPEPTSRALRERMEEWQRLVK